MELLIQSVDGTRQTLGLHQPAVIMAGYTGRNREAVLAHIEELARHGIPAPDDVPSYYPVPWQLLTLSEELIEVAGAETSGEIEPVLIVTDRGTFVAVGSDHTDRNAERHSIAMSKRLAPKIISRTAWQLADLAGHWDKLLLHSWADDVPYQDGSAQRIMPLADFPLQQLRPPGRDLVLFLGTVPLLGGQFVMAKRFRGELTDPVLKRQIGLSYSVEQLIEGATHAKR